MGTLILLGLVLCLIYAIMMRIARLAGHVVRAFLELVMIACVAGIAYASGRFASFVVDAYSPQERALPVDLAQTTGFLVGSVILGSFLWHRARQRRADRRLLEPAVGAISSTTIMTGRPRDEAGARAPARTPSGRRPDRAGRAQQQWLLSWQRMIEEADWAAVRLAVARDSCERYLASSPAPTCELAIALQRRVPEIIEDGIEHAEAMTSHERRDLLEEVVEQLELLAAEAERRRPRRSAASGKLAVRRRYVEEIIRRGRSV